MKITIPLKSQSKKSVTLVEKYFDPDLQGNWEAIWEKKAVFMNAYIQEKYKEDLYFLPFVGFRMFYDTKIDKTIFKIVDFIKYTTIDSENKGEFLPYLERYLDTRKRFTFYPFSIYTEDPGEESGFGSHGIACIYDKKTKKVEVFDSIGSDFAPYKKTLKTLFEEIYGKGIKIIYLNQCVNFGKLVHYRCNDMYYAYNAGGFCAIWVLWYLELRLANKQLSRDLVIKLAIKKLKENDKKVCELIRGYAQFVDKIFSEYTLTKTGSNLIVKSKSEKITKRNYKALFTLLATLFGYVFAVLAIDKFKKKQKKLNN
jgi:hypothetical protein